MVIPHYLLSLMGTYSRIWICVSYSVRVWVSGLFVHTIDNNGPQVGREPAVESGNSNEPRVPGAQTSERPGAAATAAYACNSNEARELRAASYKCSNRHGMFRYRKTKVLANITPMRGMENHLPAQ